ncbi:MAG: hypothetical protein IKN14_04700 [Clostridiales bacterium]|nr:hypothetical protein [Clostridiales bacterium]
MVTDTLEIRYFDSLDQLGTDLKVGVSFEKGREYYFIVGKDASGEYNKFFKSYCCDSGIAIGDLIGSINAIPGVPSSDKVYATVEEAYTSLKDYVGKLGKRTSKASIVNYVIFTYSELIYGNVSGNPFEKNLLILPLFVEVMSGLIRDGVNYNFRKSDKILSSIRKYQKTLAVFAEDVMLYEKDTDPKSAFTRIDQHRIPSVSFSGLTTLICNNPEPEIDLVEAFIPNTFDDLISYLLNRYVIGYHFYRCANCGRYFAFTTDTKNKSCTRVIESAHYIKDIGRTCRDVGRLRSHVRGLYSNETQILYQRNYKATFARKSKGYITEEHFAAWSETARQMRDKCINGDISYDELEKWFLDNYLRE